MNDETIRDSDLHFGHDWQQRQNAADIQELVGNQPISVALTGTQWRDILALLVAAKEFRIPVDTESILPIFAAVTQAIRDQTEWPEEIN